MLERLIVVCVEYGLVMKPSIRSKDFPQTDSSTELPLAMPLPWLYRVCLGTVLITGLFFILIMLAQVPPKTRPLFTLPNAPVRQPIVHSSSLLFPEHGAYVDLSTISPSNHIAITPGSIPSRFTEVSMLHLYIDVLGVGAIPETVKTLVIHYLTPDMVFPSTLENLIIVDARCFWHDCMRTASTHIQRPNVKNLFIFYGQESVGENIGIHYIYSTAFKVRDEHMRRDKYWIEEENTEMHVGPGKYYVTKRIPKV